MAQKKTLIIFSLIILFIAIFLLISHTNAQPQGTPIQLNQGKNNVTINTIIQVKQLVLEYQQIQAISYFDEKQNKTIGFINFKKGIGKPFLLIPNQTYEIISSENITIYV